MNIHFKQNGKGTPVVLIHGFCETHEIWNPVFQVLSKSFKVVAIDLPGFGKSDLPNQPFSIDDVASMIINFLINDLKLESCCVLGHSLGGYVTLAMAEQNPALVQSFGLVHSTALADSEERKLARNKVIEFVEVHGVEPYIRSFIPPLFFDQKNPWIPPVVDLALTTPLQTLISYTAAMRDRQDRTSLLSGFKGPTLFLAGKEDSVIPVNTLQKQVSLARKGSFHVLEAVSHMGMLENEAVVIEILTGFIRRSTKGAL